MKQEYDLIIVGGGLAGGLIALALAQHRPELDIAMIEAGQHLGGNHIWSFFDSDMDADARDLVAPLVTYRWEKGHQVRFPGYSRTLQTPYNSITSDTLDNVVRTAMGERVWTGVRVTDVSPHTVMTSDGQLVQARAVINARGFIFNALEQSQHAVGSPVRDHAVFCPTGASIVTGPASQAAGPFFCADPRLAALDFGWQKFVGQTLRLTAPHGIERPMIMDATVDQIDGYRFLYLLPKGPRDIFVEDTYYSDLPDLDLPVIRRRIDEYAKAQGWAVETVTHEETGALPVVHGGDFDAFWPPDDPLARAGVCAGLFQPMTGYSLALAARFALDLARSPVSAGPDLAAWTRGYAARHWRSARYFRMLGVMLFDAAAPEQRWRMFRHFYHLNEPLITRFYAGRSTTTDKLRILSGRPPVPIRAAMRALIQRLV